MTSLFHDAFASLRFHGNPSAVCIPHMQRDKGWLMHVATEMKLSETAFISFQTDGFGLRWFPPTREVTLCGQASFANAHILSEEVWLATNKKCISMGGSRIAALDKHHYHALTPLVWAAGGLRPYHQKLHTAVRCAEEVLRWTRWGTVHEQGGPPLAR